MRIVVGMLVLICFDLLYFFSSSISSFLSADDQYLRIKNFLPFSSRRSYDRNNREE